MVWIEELSGTRVQLRNLNCLWSPLFYWNKSSDAHSAEAFNKCHLCSSMNDCNRFHNQKRNTIEIPIIDETGFRNFIGFTFLSSSKWFRQLFRHFIFFFVPIGVSRFLFSSFFRLILHFCFSFTPAECNWTLKANYSCKCLTFWPFPIAESNN